MACGVFRLSFSSFLLLSSLFLLSSCSCPALPTFLLFVLFCWLCGLAFFPFRTASDTKRKGAIPCVLSCPVVVCCHYIAASGIVKLLQAVSTLRAFPAIHATVK